jgi:CRISPR/Cas system-associated exonuclease Cas4 (RecB family)
MKNKKYVTASEIGDFVYCKRGWWLRFNGLLPANREMIAGTAGHEKLSTALHTNRRNIQLAWIIILCAVVLLLAALLVLVK